MAALFEILPAQLFRPLAAPGAPIYAHILLTLLEQATQQHQPLSRDLALNLITEQIDTSDALDLTQDAGESDTPRDEDPTLARATAILRYLVQCGWLRSETQSDFTQSFVLPDYAFRLLRVLSEIAANEPPPLQGLICSIHDLLQASVREGNADIRLPEAHRQMQHLLNGLKELQHNIGAHLERVLQQMQTREVLDQFFVSYHTEIVDRVYHQLRTTDHVSRYRPGVVETTAQLSRDAQLEQAAQRVFKRGDAPSLEAAASQLLTQARAIREQFETLDTLLEAIDVRHSQFVDAAVRAVELQLLAQSTTSGQLNAILKTLLAAQDDAMFETLAAPLVNLHELALVDAQSLAPPARAPAAFVPEIETAEQLSDADIAAKQAETLAQLQRVISRRRVREFAASLLQDRAEIRAAEIPLQQPDDLPLLIYLRAYADDALGYRVTPTNDEQWIEHGEIAFRDFVLSKVEKSSP